MNRIHHSVFSSIFLAFAATAAHAGVEKATIQVEHVDYSEGYGKRNVASAEVVSSFGPTTVVINAATGKRDYGDDVFTGSRFTGAVYHDWSKNISTRTSVSASDNSPVFVNRDVSHDFNLKVIPNTVLTAGGKYAEYYGGVYASAWSAGGSYYRDRLTISYRYSKYHLSIGDGGYGNTLSFRLKDGSGDGSTQLWLGKGNSVYTQEFLSELQDSDSKNFSIRRVQPVAEKFMLSAAVGKAWHETPVARYDSVTANLGLTYKW